MNRILIITALLLFSLTGYAKNWEGKWIVNFDSQSTTNSWFAFRKQVDIDKVPNQAIARIAADSKYWMWINGKQVVFEGSLKRGPNPTDTYYDEVDIAPFLKPGQNTIAILTWYFGKDGFSHISSGKAGLLFDCVSSGLRIVSDKSWVSSRLYAYGTCGEPLPNFRLSESSICYDARKEIPDWMMPDFDDKGMGGVRVFGEAGCYPWNKLHKRSIPLFKDYGLKDYSKQYFHGDTLICELPYNCQLTPYIKVDAPAGKTIGIYTDNYLFYNGAGTGIRAEYITKEGTQEYENLAWVNGHKVYYVLPQGVKVLAAKFRESGYDTEFEGEFSCSDDFLNKLWDKSRRSLYITMRDNFMDCPDRERAQWAGDAVNESMEAYYALSVSSHALVKKWLYETVNWQRPDGSMFAPVPAGNWFDELPGQVLATIGRYGVWNYYLYTGDRQLLKDLYPGIKKYLDLWIPDGKGTMQFREGDWTWGDWGDNRDMKLLFNLWYYIAIQGMEQAAMELGYTEDVQKYQLFLTQFKQSFNHQFWNGKSYRHPEYNERTDDRVQALAVVSGIADTDKYKAILRVLQTEEHASPYMEKYIFEAMMQMGYEVEALARHKKRFSKMVYWPGFTTLFEGWGIGNEGYGGGTVNHGWSGGGLVVCSQYLCGVAPTKPGFEEFHILPQPGNVTQAQAVVPTEKGNISTAFIQDKAGFKMDANIPKGCKALLGVPVRNYREIRINGQLVWKKGKYISGLSFCPMVKPKESRHVVFSCDPGNYTILAIR